MIGSRCIMEGSRGLHCVLQRLPAAHPALLWTNGSVTASFHKRCYHNSINTKLSTFHHRSIHNIQHTLPSFRRPNGIMLYQYFNVSQAVAKSDKHDKTVCDSISSALKKSTAKIPMRALHSQKHQASQRPFILSPRGILAASPESVQPYLRLVRFDRPIGTWLLFLPCAYSISLAAPAGGLPDFYLLALFGAGSFLMRGAGCTINDMWDKDYDAKVTRTKDRPLACGEISYFQALSFLGLQLSGALAILLSLNLYTIGLGVSAISLVVLYPLMKRFTYWPQAFLGLTFNWGCLMGYSAVWQACEWSVVLPLYVGCFAWTIVYDTIYAHQDKEDDIMVGVKSTALYMGDDTKKWLTAFTTIIATCLTTTGVMCDQTWPYYAGVAAFCAHLSRQIYTVDLDNPDDCGAKFRSNRNLGLMFWLMIMAGTLLKPNTDKTVIEDSSNKIDSNSAKGERDSDGTANS